VEELLARFASRYDDEWEKVAEDVDPRAYHAVRPSVAVCKHKCWMGEAAHLQEYIPSSHMAALLRFRVCAQELEVSRARGRPRAERACRMCMAGAVEDEGTSCWSVRRMRTCARSTALMPVTCARQWQETNVGWLSVCMPPRARAENAWLCADGRDGRGDFAAD
jgi:hypothetical protein